MSDHRVAACERVRHEVKIRHLQKGVDSRRFVLLASDPSADLSKLSRDGGVRPVEQIVTVILHPLSQFIGSGSDFIGDFVDAANAAVCMAIDQPLPKRRAEVESVVQVLGLNEDVRVQQVGHGVTPRSRAAS